MSADRARQITSFDRSKYARGTSTASFQPADKTSGVPTETTQKLTETTIYKNRIPSLKKRWRTRITSCTANASPCNCATSQRVLSAWSSGETFERSVWRIKLALQASAEQLCLRSGWTRKTNFQATREAEKPFSFFPSKSHQGSHVRR